MRPITRQLVTGGPGTAAPGSGYRRIALSNTTLGTLMATINRVDHLDRVAGTSSAESG